MQVSRKPTLRNITLPMQAGRSSYLNQITNLLRRFGILKCCPALLYILAFTQNLRKFRSYVFSRLWLASIDIESSISLVSLQGISCAGSQFAQDLGGGEQAPSSCKDAQTGLSPRCELCTPYLNKVPDIERHQKWELRVNPQGLLSGSFTSLITCLPIDNHL